VYLLGITCHSSDSEFLRTGMVNTNQITSIDVPCKMELALSSTECYQSWYLVQLKNRGCTYICITIGVETGSRPFLEYRTVARIYYSQNVSM